MIPLPPQRAPGSRLSHSLGPLVSLVLAVLPACGIEHAGKEGTDPDGAGGSADRVLEQLDEAWRQTTDVAPEFFYAEDIGITVRRALEGAFSAAIGAWGNYGPIEYWVVGADVDAARDLATRYCARRSERGEESIDDCQRHGRQWSEFVEWAERSAEIRQTGRPYLDAGRNGNADWGIHLFSSSLPPGWAELASVRIEDDQTVLFHEYFHAVQHAFVLAVDWEERDRLLGPVWWVEGGAEYMAQVASEKARLRGVLPRDDRNIGGNWVVADRMARKMKGGLRTLAETPGLAMSSAEYGDDESVAYDLGCWAVAYLTHKAGEDSLLESFLPRLNELGWEGAFLATYGMTPDAFYVEFDRFLGLPLEKQVEVLPEYCR